MINCKQVRHRSSIQNVLLPRNHNNVWPHKYMGKQKINSHTQTSAIDWHDNKKKREKKQPQIEWELVELSSIALCVWRDQKCEFRANLSNCFFKSNRLFKSFSLSFSLCVFFSPHSANIRGELLLIVCTTRNKTPITKSLRSVVIQWSRKLIFHNQLSSNFS